MQLAGPKPDANATIVFRNDVPSAHVGNFTSNRARKEFELTATNLQPWNELLSIGHQPLHFFTRGRRNSTAHIEPHP
jgi:hypothetical protein